MIRLAYIPGISTLILPPGAFFGRHQEGGYLAWYPIYNGISFFLYFTGFQVSVWNSKIFSVWYQNRKSKRIKQIRFVCLKNPLLGWQKFQIIKVFRNENQNHVLLVIQVPGVLCNGSLITTRPRLLVKL